MKRFIIAISMLTVLLLLTGAAQAVQDCSRNTIIPITTPTSRFIIHGDGTATDSKTGLTWKQCVEGLSGVDCTTGAVSVMHLSVALEHAMAHSFAGHSDWRLPNIKELNSILELSCRLPAINLEVFPNAYNEYSRIILSSTGNSNLRFGVNFGSALVIGYSQAPGVRLVRDRQSVLGSGDTSTTYPHNNIIYMGRTGVDESTDELFSINSKTGGKIRLTENTVVDGSPSISPDGKTIVYSSKLDGEWDLYKMELDSRTVINLTNTDPSQNEDGPVISPKGEMFLYKLNDSGNEKLALMDLNGGNQQILLPNRYDHAAWSPSGQDIVLSGLDGLGGLDLLDVESVGSVVELTQGNYDEYPVFSNDGQYIFFASNRCGNSDTKLGIYMINLVAGTTTELHCDANLDYRYLSMTKDGRLVFTKGEDQHSVSRPVYITRKPVDAQDTDDARFKILNAVALSDTDYNDHPAAPQRHSKVSLPSTQPTLADDTPTGLNNAFVLTHGWNSTVEEWIVDTENDSSGLADKVCRELGLTPIAADRSDYYNNKLKLHCSGNDWDVWVEDWRSDAKTGLVYNEIGPIGAYGNAFGQGNQLGSELATHDYDHIQMVAHSAGSNLINQAKDTIQLIKGTNAPTIHLTFFDAYDPLGFLACGGQYSNYGENADWVENYVDKRSLTFLLGNLDATKLIMPSALNIDVTDWDPTPDPLNALARHSWPFEFYRDHTITDPGVSPPLGFSLSKAYSNAFPPQYHTLGTECSLGNYPGIGLYPVCGSTQTICNAETVVETGIPLDHPLVVIKEVSKSVTGAIRIGTLVGVAGFLWAELTTGSPAWVEFEIDSDIKFNAIKLSYEFTAPAEGLLTVFFDGRALAKYDQRFSETGVQVSPTLYIGKGLGKHYLAIKLDSFDANQANVKITDVELVDIKNISRDDLDNDGIPNDVDNDDDGDGVNDADDAFPTDPTEWSDNDSDNVGDNIDNDDDNDGFSDGIDNCELVANPDQLDTNQDGIGNACDQDGDGIRDDVDPDDDNDGFTDILEEKYASDSLDAGSHPTAYKDIVPGDLYHLATLWLDDAGVTSACDGVGNFCPDQVIHRDTAAIWLVKAFEGGTYTPGSATGLVFADIATDTFAADFIESLSLHGGTEGCDAASPLPNYCPGQPLSKAQAAKMLLKTKYGAGYSPTPAGGLVHDDVATGTFAADFIEALQAEGAAEGCSDSPPLYCPREMMTRGGFAKMLANTFGLMP